MDYKLLAIDMDDTLLDSRREISPRTVRCIRAAAARGLSITLASGRMYCSLLPYARRLGLCIPLIAYNGALIQACDSPVVLFHQPLPPADAREIVAFAEIRGIHLQLYVNDRVYVREMNEKAAFYSQHAGVPVYTGDLAALAGQQPTKLLFMDEPAQLTAFAAALQAHMGTRVAVTRSKPTFLEVIHPVVSKGAALKWLAARLGVRPEEVIAIGDSYNDLEMLEFAGCGVAMDNAPDEVKARADMITASNDAEGVAEAITALILHSGNKL